MTGRTTGAAGAAGTTPEDAGYRPVHRLSPLLRFWTLLLAILAAVLVTFDWSALTRGWEMLGAGSLLAIGGLLGAFLLICVMIWLASHPWWKATGYRLGEEEVSLKRGVISRSLRTAQYDRIQAVDVVESVVARIFRLAAVRVETAGGGDSVIEIAYLPKRDAEALRAEVLLHAAGHGADVSESAPGPDTDPDTDPETDRETGSEAAADAAAPRAVVVPEIPIHRSLLSVLLRVSSLVSAAAIAVVLISPAGPATLIPVLVGLVPVIWNYVDKSWRFTARLEEEDVLHVSYGLADRRRQSIPLRRIHGVEIHQPVLWRLTGWWEVRVSIAGYGDESNKQTGTTALLPVGSRAQAVELAVLLSPLTRAELEDYARPEGVTAAQFTSPTPARWVSPVDRRQQGVTLLDHAVIVHRGRLGRRVGIIAPAHIQELTLRRGPLQQLIGLCTVQLDLVAGPVHMAGEDLSAADGARLLDLLRDRRLPSQLPAG